MILVQLTQHCVQTKNCFESVSKAEADDDNDNNDGDNDNDNDDDNNDDDDNDDDVNVVVNAFKDLRQRNFYVHLIKM